MPSKLHKGKSRKRVTKSGTRRKKHISRQTRKGGGNKYPIFYKVDNIGKQIPLPSTGMFSGFGKQSTAETQQEAENKVNEQISKQKIPGCTLAESGGGCYADIEIYNTGPTSKMYFAELTTKTRADNLAAKAQAKSQQSQLAGKRMRRKMRYTKGKR